MGRKKLYNWLRLYDDFYDDLNVKRLLQFSGGAMYVVIYQRLLIKAMNSQGLLLYHGIAPSFQEEIALDFNLSVDDVRFTLKALFELGLLQASPDGKRFLLTAYRQEGRNLVGDSNDSTARMQKLRADDLLALPMKPEPKTAGERKASQRAKETCQALGYIPMIPDVENRKTYGLDYYLTFKRDDYKCKLCGSIKNLKLYSLCHENSDAKNVTCHEICHEKNVTCHEKNVTCHVTCHEKSNMITLCSDCYSDICHEKNIPRDILESIGFTDSCHDSHEICDAKNVTCHIACHEKCDAIEIDKDININKSSSSSACAREEDCVTKKRDMSQKNSVTKKRDTGPENDREKLEQVVTLWNTLTDVGIKPLHALWPHAGFGKNVLELVDIYGFDSFEIIVNRIRDSDYLLGLTPRLKNPIDFEWLLNGNNYQSVLNGKYDTHRKALPDKRQSSKVQNFIQMQERKENWDVLESKLLDN